MKTLVTMKKWIIAPLFFLFMVACSQDSYQSIPWQSKLVEVDGVANEWNIPLKHYDKNLKLNYQFSNDGEYLYFAARTTEMQLIHHIMRGGLTIEMDTMPKSKNYPYSLTFPFMPAHPKMGPMQGEPMRENNPTMEADTQEPSYSEPQYFNPNQQQMMSPMLSQFQIKGFGGIAKDSALVVPMDQAGGIRAHCTPSEDGILFYEVAIPLNSIFSEKSAILDTTKIYSCSISLAMNMNEHKPMPQNGNMGDMPQPPGGGMGNPGGGMGGPPPGGGMGSGPGGNGGFHDGRDMQPQQTDLSKHKIEHSFKLSYQL